MTLAAAWLGYLDDSFDGPSPLSGFDGSLLFWGQVGLLRLTARP